MTVGDFGRRPTAQNLVTQSQRFLVPGEQASAIVREMREIVRSQWEIVARAAKVSVEDCATIRNALENEGFEFDAAAGEAGTAWRSRLDQRDDASRWFFF